MNQKLKLLKRKKYQPTVKKVWNHFAKNVLAIENGSVHIL